MGAVCDWMGPQSPITDHTETSFITRVGPAELAASSADCPWLVRARSGQRLNLTVHFTPPPAADHPTTKTKNAGTSALCALVVDVVDGNRTTTLKPPCGADRHRERQTYSSVSNELKVYVRSTGGATYAAAAAVTDDAGDDVLSSTLTPGFLLHYHGLSH